MNIKSVLILLSTLAMETFALQASMSTSEQLTNMGGGLSELDNQLQNLRNKLQAARQRGNELTAQLMNATNETRVVENRSTMQQNDLVIVQRELDTANQSNAALEELLVQLQQEL